MKSKHQSPGRLDDGHAFLPEPTTGIRSARSADADFFGEEYVASALTGESCNEEVRDEVVADEEGGFQVIGEDSLIGADGESIIDFETPESTGTLVHEQVLRGGRWAARGG